MIFICNGKGQMDVMMLYNVDGEYRESVLKWTKIYRLDIDGKEHTLSNKEIIEPVRVTGDNYVGVVRCARRWRTDGVYFRSYLMQTVTN
jgi:hypothetical protein